MLNVYKTENEALENPIKYIRWAISVVNICTQLLANRLSMKMKPKSVKGTPAIQDKSGKSLLTKAKQFSFSAYNAQKL